MFSSPPDFIFFIYTQNYQALAIASMSPAYLASQNNCGTRDEDDYEMSRNQKGVQNLYQSGIKRVPSKYILPVSERAITTMESLSTPLINLPVIDFSELQGPNRARVIQSLQNACQEFGFFQVYI